MILTLVLASAVYGATASDPVTVSCTVDNFISISSPVNLTMANIVGTGGSTSGNVIWSVTTNNSTGYKLEVYAGGAPALTKGADSFADYARYQRHGQCPPPTLHSVSATTLVLLTAVLTG